MSSNMVRDNEIKATVSPFAIRPGEIKVFDGKMVMYQWAK